jgi:polyhydroxyalkanoate synthesis regulator phasin
MKRKIILMTICCILLVLPLTACFANPSSSKTTAPSITDRVTVVEKSDAAQNKDIDSLQNQVKSIPSAGSISDVVSKADNAMNKATSLESELNSLKTTVNDLKDRIADLEDDNSSSGSSSSSDSADGILVSNNKELELWLTDINPSDLYTLSVKSGGDRANVWWDFDVVNNDSIRHYYKIRIYITPDEKVKNEYGTDDDYLDVRSDITSLKINGNGEIDGGADGKTDDIVVTIYDGWIGKNDIVSLTVRASAYVTNDTNNDKWVDFSYSYNIQQTD